MNRRFLAIMLILMGFMVSVNIFSHWYLRDVREGIKLVYRAPRAILPPELIRIIAGEFKGLLANYMLLEVGSFEGSNQVRTPEDYINVYRGLKQAMALDPYFQQTYMLSQGILPWRAQMVDEANELLETARRHREWDWRPGHYMGFNYYYFLNDYAKSSEVLLETAQIKGAPVLLAVLGARFAQRAKRTAAAIDLLERMLQDEDISHSHQQELRERTMALKGVLILEQAIAIFQNDHGFSPPSLQTLVDYRVLDTLPPNPYGDKFLYDSNAGSISFDEIENRLTREK